MPRRVSSLLALLTIVPLLGAAETSPASGSAVPAASPAPATSTRWELLALLGSGATTAVRIRDTEENTATWIRVGESFGPLKLLATDGEANTATIQVGEVRSLLRLRAAAVAAGAITPVATGTTSDSTARTAAASPAPLPSTGDAEADVRRDQAIAEREARMLVSDLLEISMIQRKAYEEKQAAASQSAVAPAP